MYIRSDRKTRADGTTCCYLSLAHNVWEPVGDDDNGKKRARPVIFARLGVEDQLDLGTIQSMRDAFDRYLQKRLARERPEAADEAASTTTERVVKETAAELRPKLEPLKFLATREYGLRVILEPVWKELGLRKAMQAFAAEHRFEFDFERVVFGMVLNRLVDPKSKRACNEWLANEAYFPEADEWHVRQFYRAMDALHHHAEELDRHVMNAIRERRDPETRKLLLLLDTTSTFVESDYDDAERAQMAHEWQAFYAGEADQPAVPEPQVVNDPPLRMRGHSKDKRPDKPQVVVGFVAITDGLVMRHRTYPGNTNDQTITMDLLADALEVSEDARPVVVLDSGTGGGPNLRSLDEMEPPVDRISAVPVRNSRVARDALLSRAGRSAQHPTKPHLT